MVVSNTKIGISPYQYSNSRFFLAQAHFVEINQRLYFLFENIFTYKKFDYAFSTIKQKLHTKSL